MLDKNAMSPRAAFRFSPPYETILDGIETAYRAHLPTAEFLYFDCGACEQLHLLVIVDGQEEIGLSVNIPEGGWTRIPLRN